MVVCIHGVCDFIVFGGEIGFAIADNTKEWGYSVSCSRYTTLDVVIA